MSHPQCCTDPDCTRSYVDHLRGFSIGLAALPTRGGIHRTPGQPDEPAQATEERCRRWERENEAFKTLTLGGHEPESFADAPAMLKELGG